MKVIGHMGKFPAHRFKFFNGKIKKVLIVGFEADFSAFLQDKAYRFRKSL